MKLNMFASRGRLIALATIAVAGIVALRSAFWVSRHPSTSDASIDVSPTTRALVLTAELIAFRVSITRSALSISI